jgi:hypothetical protein
LGGLSARFRADFWKYAEKNKTGLAALQIDCKNFQAILNDPRPEERLTLSQIYELYCVSGRQNAGVRAKNLLIGTKAWLSTLSL